MRVLYFIYLVCIVCFLVALANGEKIYLKSFDSNKIGTLVDFIKSNELVGDTIHATGGGAHKYADLFESEFGSRGV